jgi:hypothetical protein
LTHGQVKTFRRVPRAGIMLIGVSEPDPALLKAHGVNYGLASSVLFADLGKMKPARKR